MNSSKDVSEEKTFNVTPEGVTIGSKSLSYKLFSNSSILSKHIPLYIFISGLRSIHFAKSLLFDVKQVPSGHSK